MGNTICTIQIRLGISSTLADDDEKGNKIFDDVKEKSKECDEVILDFEGIELVNTAFLNNAIGKLFDSEQYKLNEHPVKIANMNSNDMKDLLYESIEAARAKYQ